MNLLTFARSNSKTIVVALVLLTSVVLFVSSLARKSEQVSGIVTAFGYLAESILKSAS